MTTSDDRDNPRRIDEFLGDDPTRDRAAWKWLWEGDLAFPVQGRDSALGRLSVLAKKLLRPLIRLGGADLFDRQRVFNLILLDDLRSLEERHRDQLATLADEIRKEMRKIEARVDTLEVRLEARVDTLEVRLEARMDGLEVRTDDVEGLTSRLDQRTDHLEAFLTEGLEELMRYDDALYSRIDQKLDAYRREAKDFVSTFSTGLATRKGAADRPVLDEGRLEEALGDLHYQELEKRFRGSGEEIRGRIEVYLPLLEGRSRVLDLGCGRGEALALLRDVGIAASGVDSSAEMVRLCREQGLEAVAGDLMTELAGREPGSLDGVVSFHVIEHFRVADVDRLVKLAWRALAPGGIVILETPNPTSLTMAANLFWRDPTHVRPVHPDVLRLSMETAGFDQVEIRPLHPYPDQERLPEISLEGLEGSERELADRVNRLRDHLDEALFGHRDYAAIGLKSS